MTAPPGKINELTASKHEYIVALKAQINKDLAKAGNFSFDCNEFRPDEWCNRLTEIMSKMTTHECDHFLYVVDLPENWSKNLKQTENPNTQLAMAVLQREWQKIYFRLKLS